ncbi:LysR family transcriptional regulator [Niveispirillum lacus]|uniref:LysR family transcriptional regulator n=1 Tax=Niveispirillum lacus TaxID=1981099 RepID=A0A255Z118_9PROT|nr:LysR substrate-binding domain-containing protein [Niveispirillum lacus]OYQ34605.1 LysR family transcriptional regulator [Niveispirillum lacus]
MNNDGPDFGLRALRAFHAIVKTGSVTAAATAMGLTQPAVSRLLAQFEQTIGFDLFYRDKGRLVPTPDGLLLFDEADLALGTMERVRALARDIADFQVGQLRLVAPPSFAEGVLPDVIDRFLSRFPKVHLTIDSRSVETSKTLIATRAVDGGFLKLPLDRPDLTSVPVANSGTVCVLPIGHPLAARSWLDPLSLKGVPLVLLGLGRLSRSHIDAAFARAGVRPEVRVETHTIGSACALATRGIGVAIVNEMLARSYLGNRLLMRPFRPDLRHEYAFVTSAMVAPPRLALEFLSDAKHYFAQQPKDVLDETAGSPV